MRELTVDFSLENPLSGGAEAGYIGEHNATTMVVKPGEEILATGCASYAVVFLTKGEVFRSDYFEPADEFRIDLGAHLTRDHYLSLQIEGYSEEKDMIYKSPMVTKIHFMPSINGEETEFDETEYKLYTQVLNNTKSRHQHPNYEVIDGLSDLNGKLLYKGEPIEGLTKTKTVELSYNNGEVDFNIDTSGGFRMDIGTYIENIVPNNSEIRKIEFQIDSEDCPEWLDLREMAFYDLQKPYIIRMHRPFYNNEMGMTIFCRVYFISGYNKFVNYINAFLLNKVRITYAENAVN